MMYLLSMLKRLFTVSAARIFILALLGALVISIPLLLLNASLPVALITIVIIITLGVVGIRPLVSLPKAIKPLEHDEVSSVLYGLEDAVVAYTKDFTVTMVNAAAEHLFVLPDGNSSVRPSNRSMRKTRTSNASRK